MNLSEQFLCATIIVFGLDACHWKPGLLGKTKPLVSKYGVMVVHLDYGDLIMRIQWLNTFGPILQDFSKLQMEFSVNGKLFVLRGDMSNKEVI